MNACIASAHINSDDFGLIALPFTSSYANTEELLAYLFAGMTTVLMVDTFTAHAFFVLVESQHITRMEWVPTMLHHAAYHSTISL